MCCSGTACCIKASCTRVFVASVGLVWAFSIFDWYLITRLLTRSIVMLSFAWLCAPMPCVFIYEVRHRLGDMTVRNGVSAPTHRHRTHRCAAHLLYRAVLRWVF